MKTILLDKANDTLLASPSRLHPSTSPTELEIIRSSMTGKASQICVFGAGLYEAKKQHKATFKIDASQAGKPIEKRQNFIPR